MSVDVEGTTGTATGIRRRSLVVGAAWSVPAVVMMASAPAFASSTTPRVLVSAGGAFLPAAGATPIAVTVTDAAGQPAPGAPVSLTGPATAVFDSANGVADGAGVFRTNVDLCAPWTEPGETVTITAMSGGESGSVGLTVLSSNALAVGWRYGGRLRQMERVFPSPVVKAVSSWSFSAAVLENGTVWTLGENAAGQLGDGTTADRPTWGAVPGLSDVVDIALGEAHVIAHLNDGRVMSWGRGTSGQLGDGTMTDRPTPAFVSGVSDVRKLMSGPSNGWVLKGDGSVWAWGWNHVGQLGNGQTASAGNPTPAPVQGLSTAVDLTSSDWSCIAQVADGSFVGWGQNNFGQLGDGTTTDRSLPVPTLVGVSGVTQLASGQETSYALLTDGTVRAWGRNDVAQVGDGTTTDALSPVSVSALSGVTAIAGVGQNGFAMTNGGLWGWGRNDAGQVGTGTYGSTVLTASAVPLPSGVSSIQLAGSTGFDGSTYGGKFFRAAIGQSTESDLALGAAVSASSTDGWLFAANVNDGLPASRWGSDYRLPHPDDAWIQVDLGGRPVISRVVLTWENASAKSYVVETAPDGSTWTVVFSTTSGAGGVATITFPPTTASSVRMRGIERNTSWGYSLYGFEVYAS